MDQSFDGFAEIRRLILLAKQEHYSVAETAVILRLSPFRVRELLKRGLLKGFKSDRPSGPHQKWVISAEAIREYQAGRGRGYELPDAGCPFRAIKPPLASSASVQLTTEALSDGGK